MGASDRTLRPAALPFSAGILGYNRNESSDTNVSVADALGDIFTLAGPTYGGTPVKDTMIRFLKPSNGTIIAAYLSIALTLSSLDTANGFKLSLSHTTSDQDFTTVVPTAAQINTCMIQLTGATTAYTPSSAGQPIVIDGLQLLQAIPAPADANFRRDTIVLGIHFNSAPLTGNGYALRKLKIDMSAIA